MPEVSVVIPTYREQDNLARLLPALFQILDRTGPSAEVIVVDDDSRDGTDDLCDRLAPAHVVRLVTRLGERGLATAVLRGLQEARGEICVVMDADFSHPPAMVPALIAAVRSPECDMAIGSRYVAGGAVDDSWSWFRRLNSRAASLLARGLTDAADPMAGFFAIKTATLSRATTLRPLGYKIALELIVRCQCRNVVEVPIMFRDRTIGESKLSFAQQWLYLQHLGRLYLAHYVPARFQRQPNESIELNPSQSPAPERRAA